ncbi:hypothetical protein BQ8420_02475 [Nocardiopsis sp. JB363]|nr:hypothetical protein BQ8420_02475 [Nocardiopsis sp. JB363]
MCSPALCHRVNNCVAGGPIHSDSRIFRCVGRLSHPSRTGDARPTAGFPGITRNRPNRHVSEGHLRAHETLGATLNSYGHRSP